MNTIIVVGLIYAVSVGLRKLLLKMIRGAYNSRSLRFFLDAFFCFLISALSARLLIFSGDQWVILRFYLPLLAGIGLSGLMLIIGIVHGIGQGTVDFFQGKNFGERFLVVGLSIVLFLSIMWYCGTTFLDKEVH